MTRRSTFEAPRNLICWKIGSRVCIFGRASLLVVFSLVVLDQEILLCYQYVVSRNILVGFFCNFLIFTRAVLLCVELIRWLDCVFCQVYYCVHSYYQSTRSLFFMAITLGLGQLCIRENRSPLANIASIIASPLMSISLLVVFYVMASKDLAVMRHFQRFQRRKSISHVLWLLILWSTGVLTFSSLLLVWCNKLGRDNVLIIDATTVCFSPKHWPYVGLAIGVLVVFVLPAPVILFWRPIHRWPWLVGIIDEATHLYEPHCHWFAWYNLVRRILFSLVSGLVSQGVWRRSMLTLLLVFQLVIHGLVR